MKLSLIAVAAIALIGCTINVPPSPDPQPSSGTGTGQNPPVKSQKLDCGEVVTQCNCGQTQAYPGLVEQSPKCESGSQFYDTCGYCGPGAYAWYSACYCE